MEITIQLVNMILQYKILKCRLYYKALSKLTDIKLHDCTNEKSNWNHASFHKKVQILAGTRPEPMIQMMWANVTGKDCTIGTQLSLPVPNQHYFSFLLFFLTFCTIRVKATSLLFKRLTRSKLSVLIFDVSSSNKGYASISSLAACSKYENLWKFNLIQKIRDPNEKDNRLHPTSTKYPLVIPKDYLNLHVSTATTSKN